LTTTKKETLPVSSCCVETMKSITNHQIFSRGRTVDKKNNIYLMGKRCVWGGFDTEKKATSSTKNDKKHQRFRHK
jgi:hypothetical protein